MYSHYLKAQLHSPSNTEILSLLSDTYTSLSYASFYHSIFFWTGWTRRNDTVLQHLYTQSFPHSPHLLLKLNHSYLKTLHESLKIKVDNQGCFSVEMSCTETLGLTPWWPIIHWVLMLCCWLICVKPLIYLWWNSVAKRFWPWPITRDENDTWCGVFREPEVL